MSAPNGDFDGLTAEQPAQPEGRGDGSTFFGLSDEQLTALAAAETTHKHTHKHHKES